MKNGNIYKFSFPLLRTHLGVPLGNGGFGALVWGKEGQLNITVSRNDFWDHRNGQVIRNNGISYKKIIEAYADGDFEKIKRLYASSVQVDGNFPSTLIPCGRFELKLKNGETLKDAELDIRSGKLTINLSSSKAILLHMSLDVDILQIDDKAVAIESLEPAPAWRFIEDKMKERLFEPPVIVNKEKLSGWIQSCPADPSLAALSEKNASGFIINLSLGENNGEAYSNSLSVMNEYSCREKEFAEKNRVFWKKYWNNTPKIDIPSEFFNRFVPFALYRFACATNPSAKNPSPLQGPWIEEYQFPPWGANYTVNINIEQIYTLAFYTGNIDFLKPLFKMLESEPFTRAMSGNAKSMFGIDDGYLLTHSVNDLGMQCQNGFSTHSALDHAVTAWMAQLYWLYYRHSQDRDFLRDRAYPFMLRVMRVYEEMLEERDGKLSIPLAPSPEYGVGFKVGGRRVQEGRNPSMQLACAHMLADALLEAAEILGIRPREKWLDIKKRLPSYTLIDDEAGKRIALWEGQDLDQCHRHHSHLGAIYPFDTLGEMTPEKAEIVDNSLDHWIGKGMGLWSEWCMPWAAIIQIRAGLTESPIVLLELWKELFVNESLTTVYLPKFRGISAHRKNDIPVPREKNEIFQLEGTMGAATAVYEMLAHVYSGVLKIFPAVPAKWKDVSFSRLHLSGGLIVSGRKKNGEVAEITIKGGKSPVKTVIDVPGTRQMLLKRGDKNEPFKFPGSIELKPGETITFQS